MSAPLSHGMTLASLNGTVRQSPMRIPDQDDFAEMARTLNEAPTVDETLERIVQLALKSLDCTYAGISYSETRVKKVETGAASHEVVRAGDQAQYELGEGPCLQALVDGKSYRTDDTVGDERWPRWGERAQGLGLRSTLGVQLWHDGTILGALNLYSAEVGHFDDDDLQVTEVYAAHAAVALGRSRKESHLRRAIDSRHLVGMAQGILMERFGLDQQRAFAVLRRYSQHHNIKIRIVAEQLVATRELPDGSASPDLDASQVTSHLDGAAQSVTES